MTIREFDLGTKSFVKTGFELPKGKQGATWLDENTLLVSREWKPGELTESGYAYIVKRLKRGQPLSAAVELFRGTKKDVSAGAGVLRDAENRTLPLIVEGTDFWHSKNFVIGPKGNRRIGIPEKAQLVDMIGGRVIIQTQEAWSAGGKEFPAGSLLVGRPGAASREPGAPQANPDLCARPARGARGCICGQGRATRFDPRQCPWQNVGL